MVDDVTDGFRDWEIEVARLAVECCVLAMRELRLGRLIEDDRGASLPGPKLRAILLRFCCVDVVVGRAVDDAVGFPAIMLDLLDTRLSLFAL